MNTSLAKNQRVDILLCTYNRAHLIEQAVTSVQQQNYSHWALSVIDDGSTDTTRELIKHLASKDERISYFYYEHRGLAHARNMGIGLSQGDYITFIDSDDIYLPDHLKLRVQYLQENQTIDLLHGGVELIGPEHEKYVVDVHDRGKLIHLTDCCIGATLFGKAQVFKQLNGFKIIDYSSESDFLARAEQRFEVRKVHYPTYQYHLEHEDRKCKSIKQKSQSSE